MGETTCLMRPFSYAAGLPCEAKEGNPIHALGQSISFGRFVTEPLEWEKWSTFSSNRYVEEAERFSRPGSVAQMKAFFEAHYKNLAARKAAAALLEKANVEATDNVPPEAEHMTVTETENDGVRVSSGQDSLTLVENSKVVVDKQIVIEKFNVEERTQEEESVPVTGTSALMENYVMNDSENPVILQNCTENNTINSVPGENCIQGELLSQTFAVDNIKEEVKEVELSAKRQMERPLLKDFVSNTEASLLTSTKKSSSASSKSVVLGRASKTLTSPTKPMVSSCACLQNIATPISTRRPALDGMDKKKSTPKSTHKSMNFTPVREINRITSSIIRKIDGSRNGSSNAKASKNFSTPLKTPNTNSRFGEPKQQPLFTPLPENAMLETPPQPLALGSKTARSKWNFLPTDCTKFMSARKTKPQSPTLSTTPFTFRTEERAARRKKLEENFNANQAQKLQMQASLMEKAETEIKKLRKSLCFKARPLPDFYKDRTTPKKNEMEKVPLARSQTPERKPTLSSNSQPPHMTSTKKGGSKIVAGKNTDNLRTLAARLKAFNTENISPNIL